MSTVLLVGCTTVGKVVIKEDSHGVVEIKRRRDLDGAVFRKTFSKVLLMADG